MTGTNKPPPIQVPRWIRMCHPNPRELGDLLDQALTLFLSRLPPNHVPSEASERIRRQGIGVRDALRYSIVPRPSLTESAEYGVLVREVRALALEIAALDYGDERISSGDLGEAFQRVTTAIDEA